MPNIQREGRTVLMRGVRVFLVVRDAGEGGGDGEMEREVSTRREERETV